MGSKTSKTERHTSVKTESVVVPIAPRIPPEIVDEILGHLDTDWKSLRSCSLVSKSWVPSCRRRIFHTTFIGLEGTARWLKRFPVPEESPARHVRDLHFTFEVYRGAPEKFFEHTPWFTNVEKMILFGLRGSQLSRSPSFARLPQSVTSLTISSGTISLLQLRDVMVQLPNVDDFSLLGSLVTVDRNTSPGIGTALRGRFGGQLRLQKGYAETDVINMLLEVPTGLRFTEVQIHSRSVSLSPTVRLAEACGNTLVKLSYAVTIHDSREDFGQFFDFSKLPNLQEVNIEVGLVHGGLLWVPMALSTLKPATSPRLFAIRFSYFTIHARDPDIGAIKEDLRRTADEVARIRCEFEGAVDVAMNPNIW